MRETDWGNEGGVDIRLQHCWCEFTQFLVARASFTWLHLLSVFFTEWERDIESDRLQVTGWEREREKAWGPDMEANFFLQVPLYWDSCEIRGQREPTRSYIHQNDLQHRRSTYRASCSPRPPETDPRHQSWSHSHGIWCQTSSHSLERGGGEQKKCKIRWI